MALSNTDFANDLINLLVSAGVAFTDQVGAKDALITLLPQWNDGSVSRTALAAALSAQIDSTTVWENELTDWWNGTLIGGPNSDGDYPFTDKFGVVTLHPCPVKMLNSIAAGAVTSVEASAASASSDAATATAQASLATTKATAAAASATAAATSQATATTQAGVSTTEAGLATVQATASAASATASSGSAAAAASSATAAAAARDAAMASFASFNDHYLGTKAADPTVDNDGNPLVAGALYFNTGADAMKIYTGSSWVAAYVTGTGFVAKLGDTMSGALTISIGSATTAAGYFFLTPTDYGVGKPRLQIAKNATASQFDMTVYDGSSYGALTLNGSAILTAASLSSANVTSALGFTPANAATLGTASTKNTGTSGATVPLLNTAVTWSGSITMSGGGKFIGALQGNADTATNATYATSAGSAASATNAGYATSAGSAGYAGTAGSANGVASGVIVPSSLSSGGPSWDSSGNLSTAGGIHPGNDSDFYLTMNVSIGPLLNFNANCYLVVSRSSGVLSFINNGNIMMTLDLAGNLKIAGSLTQNVSF